MAVVLPLLPETCRQTGWSPEIGSALRRLGHDGHPGHSYDIDVVIDDTIATIYVDGVALSARMYDRPGTGIAAEVVDGELTVERAALSRLHVG